MIIRLTWNQVRKLEKMLAILRTAGDLPEGELKNEPDGLMLEWSDQEVKVTLPD